MSKKLVKKDKKVIKVNGKLLLSKTIQSNNYEYNIHIELKRIDTESNNAYIQYEISKTDGTSPSMENNYIRYYVYDNNGNLHGAYFDEELNDIMGITELSRPGNCQISAEILDNTNKIISNKSNIIVLEY